MNEQKNIYIKILNLRKSLIILPKISANHIICVNQNVRFFSVRFSRTKWVDQMNETSNQSFRSLTLIIFDQRLRFK